MKSIEISKNLASYAVYKELYDSQKDSYDIIAEFIKSVLKKRNKRNITSQEVVTFLKEDFDFQIPESIIKTTLRTRLKFKKLNGVFSSAVDYISEDLSIEIKQEQIIENNEHIIDNLFRYIEQEKNITLKEKEKEHISQAFSSFLLNGNGLDSNYYKDISSYIILNQSNVEFQKQLNTIKQGVILYSGIRYGEITEKRKQLQNNLTIYLDTEIIFHIAGYNGNLYQDLFNEFYSLVKEFNSIKKSVYFKYFQITQNEINSYFKKAEELLEKPAKVDPSKAAMNYIIEGCETKSDIVSKKTKLFKLLETLNITLDPTEIFLNEETQKYNLISTELIEDLKNKGYKDYEIENSLNKLNAINILRGERYNNNFNNICYILLSGNSKIFKFGWNEHLKARGEVPLVTYLDFLINKFWLMLNKGFGNSNLPKTFDVVTKAQIILATSINSNINDKYEQLQEEVRQGNLEKGEIIDTIYALKNEVKQPEEITKETLSNILDSLSINDIEQHKNEKEKYKQLSIDNEKENIKLKEDIDSIKQLTEQQKQELLQEKQEKLLALEKLKKIADEKSNKKIIQYKSLWSLLIIIYYIGFIFSIYEFGWDTMEKWTWIIGSLPLIVSVLYTIIYEKTIKILNHISHKKEDYIQKEYDKLELNIDKMSQLKVEIQNIQQNLAPNR